MCKKRKKITNFTIFTIITVPFIATYKTSKLQNSELIKMTSEKKRTNSINYTKTKVLRQKSICAAIDGKDGRTDEKSRERHRFRCVWINTTIGFERIINEHI